MNDADQTHEMVKDAYGRLARQQGAGCCCSKECAPAELDVPQADLGVSCGNPVAFSLLKSGDVVVDLGSGAGRDVFLAARQGGERGRAIGVDMTPDMLKLARRNAVAFFETTGLTNVEFREGQIEDLPLEGESADVVISNCVINLAPDKGRVFREARRVLRPGGRMIVSDIVLNGPLPQEVRNNADLYTACLAGALRREEYLEAIRKAGFADVRVLSDVTYQAHTLTGETVADALAGLAASVTVLAVK